MYFLWDIMALKKKNPWQYSSYTSEICSVWTLRLQQGFAVKYFGFNSRQIFSSFIGNFQINSENIHVEGAAKTCFQILKQKRMIS